MLAMLALVGSAFAQSNDIELNSQVFHPTIDGDRTLWTDDSTRLPSGTARARLVLSYTNRPFIYVPAGGTTPVNLVSDALQANVLVGYTLGPVRLGVDLPVYLLTVGELEDGGAGVGDLAVDVKGSLLDREDYGVGVALFGRAMLDTSSVSLPLGEGKPRVELGGIVDTQQGDWLLTANLGARLAPKVELENVTLNDQLFARLGAGYEVVEGCGVSLDVAGHHNLSAAIGNPAATPIEAMLGSWYRSDGGFALRVGAGTGLTTGIGSPVFRGVLGVGYEPGGGAADTDGDGIPDKSDACPSVAEDVDAFQDEDGCPDTDNDADSILDADDTCPNEAEDYDGHEDTNGCPETATSVDVRVEDPNGVLVPNARSHVFGTGVDLRDDNEFSVVLEPGLYSIDTEAPGFIPRDDRFQVPVGQPFDYVQVLEPAAPMGRVRLRVIQSDGSPIDGATWTVPGRDATPVSDAEISLAPGSYAVSVRAPGYAPTVATADVVEGELSRVIVMLQPSRVVVVGDRIDLKEKVFFDTARATIKPESFPMLDEVAHVMAEHPAITRIRIEGHTDSRGSDTMNLDLSTRRAASVLEYLVGKGVSRDRMESAGFGESRPLDPREIAEAWDKNRRVEIFIIERSD
jgi:outer membrane protein OmpA-like peptidoglycan-associated protein